MAFIQSCFALALLDIGPVQLLVILIVALLLFGKRLPEVARSMGRSIQEFKKGLNEAQREIQDGLTDNPPPRQTGNEPASPPGNTPTQSSQTAPPAEDTSNQQQSADRR
jgi:sec-independent protein translocase protein TatA